MERVGGGSFLFEGNSREGLSALSLGPGFPGGLPFKGHLPTALAKSGNISEGAQAGALPKLPPSVSYEVFAVFM